MKAFDFFIELIERRPSVGYIGAITPTATGFWALIEGATKIAALFSIIVGLAVGIVTLHVQLLQRRKLKTELNKNNQ